MKRYLIDVFLIVLMVIIMVNLVRSVSHLWSRDDILEEEAMRLKKAQVVQDQLKRKLAQAKTPQFQEKMIRERLNSGKEDETVVLLPTIEPILADSPSPTPTHVPWKQWRDLFF